MKKTMLMIAAGAMMFTAACTSTDTSTDTASTAETATATDAAMGTTGTADATAGTTGTTSSAGTTGTMGTDADVTTVTDLDDPAFMMNAASANMLEIELGRMAVQNAANADVKKYGQMMVDHHSKANQEAMALAKQLNIQLPTTLMPMHQAMVDKLKGKTGKDFDEDFMDIMETSHKMTIAMFEAKSNNAQNAQVKALATKMLPQLRSHLEMATKLEDTVD
ncbi:DUF4142 domain-containing protein [Rufibacter ruber]|uniref:DUF4142 domain-containing protein n=1 Tax=Rufibacter ruber TaxID=1783499 RepID=UPI00082A63F1|nr:DUF4142 domain-containing protein [Rufibacter ruber]